MPGTPQKTRARDLLRKHYGLGLGPPPPLGNGKSSQDPMNFGERWSNVAGECCELTACANAIDSAVFDARAYYEQLITTSSLPTLLKTENDLLTGMLFSQRKDRVAHVRRMDLRNAGARQRTPESCVQPPPRAHRR